MVDRQGSTKYQRFGGRDFIQNTKVLVKTVVPPVRPSSRSILGSMSLLSS